MTFSGWVATLAGWYVTEIGRQPWLVTGVLSTAEAATTLPAQTVGTSLLMYAVVYALLLWAYVHTLRVMALRSVTVEEMVRSDRGAQAASSESLPGASSC